MKPPHPLPPSPPPALLSRKIFTQPAAELLRIFNTTQQISFADFGTASSFKILTVIFLNLLKYVFSILKKNYEQE